MKNIYVWWSTSKTLRNYGDELNPYIISKLSGYKVKYVPVLGPVLKSLYKAFFMLLYKRITIFDIITLVRSFFKKRILVGIGSIIQWYEVANAQIWGSGLIESYGSIHNADFLAVRGIITQRRILELGYKAPLVLGDPALLLPLIYSPEIKSQYELGVIPHFRHYDEAVNMFKGTDVPVIDLRSDDIELVTRTILSCKKIVSSSLHGLIVPHSYGIQAVWGQFFSSKLSGDDVKFLDYFSSVGILPYEPFRVTPDIDRLLLFFNEDWESRILPQVDLKNIQKELLRVAPFHLRDEFRSFIEL